MMLQTEKLDWYTKILSSEKAIYLSDDDLILKICNRKSDYEFSIRFIGNKKLGYYFVLVIKLPDNNFLFTQYLSEIAHISKIINLFFSQEIPIVCCSKELSATPSQARFSFYDSQKQKFYEASADELSSSVFKVLNSQLVKDPGEVKELNKTMNDDFQSFTRTMLSKYVVVNDIDSIIFEKELFVVDQKKIFVELKRIDIEYNSLADWEPYLDDFGNYSALQKIAKINNAHMRIVVYPKDASEYVALHNLSELDPSASKDSISGLKIICDVKSSYQIPAGVKYLSRKSRKI